MQCIAVSRIARFHKTNLRAPKRDRRVMTFQIMDKVRLKQNRDVVDRRRRSDEFMNGLTSQPALLRSFQTTRMQLEDGFPRLRVMSSRRTALIAIVLSKNRLLMVAGGRLCATVVRRLLSLPGHSIESPSKHGLAILSRRHFFHEAPTTRVATLKGCVGSVAVDPTSPLRQVFLGGHSGENTVSSVTIDPTGRFLATGRPDGSANVWRIARSIKDVCLELVSSKSAPDEEEFRWLTTYEDDNDSGIRRNFTRLSYLARFALCIPTDGMAATCVSTVAEHSGPVSSVVFDPTGRFLATGSHDGCVKVWRVSPDGTVLTCVQAFAGHRGSSISSVAFDSTGSFLLTGSWDKTAKMWRLSTDGTAACVATLAGHSGAVESVAFDPTGRFLATGSIDKTARVWRLLPQGFFGTAAICVASLVGHRGHVSCITFDPTGRFLATGSHDNTAKVWRLAHDDTAATCVATLGRHRGPVSCVAFDPTGRFLATCDNGGAHLWK